MYSTCMVSKENLPLVRRLNLAIYPVAYSKIFYQQLIDNPLCRLFMLNNQLIASVCCKSDVIRDKKVLYIQSLGVSPLHRESGLGSKLLEFVEEKAKIGCFERIMLHVQVSNSTAIDFYRNRGYSILDTVANYYSRCQETDAHLMMKEVNGL